MPRTRTDDLLEFQMEIPGPPVKNDQCLCPKPKVNRVEVLLKLLGCLAAEPLLWLLHLVLLAEMPDLLGIEFDVLLADMPVIGTLFAFAPDLTAKEPMAGLMAAKGEPLWNNSSN